MFVAINKFLEKINTYESVCVTMNDGISYIYDRPTENFEIVKNNSYLSSFSINCNIEAFITKNIDAIKEISIVEDGVQIFKVVLRP